MKLLKRGAGLSACPQSSRPVVLLLIAFILFTSSLLGADALFFIQASDPQFGMFTENRDFQQETANWEFAVANINRLKPAFVVVTGDLTNAASAAQITEYKRINAKLNPAIHLYNAPGNHDVENQPTPETLAAYHKTFGPDYYSFHEGGIFGIVLDSSLFKAPERVGVEAAAQEKWLEAELPKAAGATIVVFQHIPFFLEKADEPDVYFNIPMATRTRILSLLHRYGVKYVFAGHYHRSAFGKDGELEMITSGPVGMPLDAQASGFRIAELKQGKLEQTYYSLGTIPNIFPIPVKKQE